MLKKAAGGRMEWRHFDQLISTLAAFNVDSDDFSVASVDSSDGRRS